MILISRKIFLLTCLILGSSYFSVAQTGADMLYNSDTLYNVGIDAARLSRESIPFQANIRSYYLSQNFENSSDREAFVIGGSLNWNPTFWNNYLKGEFTLSTSQKVYGPLNKDGTMLLAPEQKSYSVLSEYNLSGSIKRFSYFLGAREFSNPLFSGIDIRMTPITNRGASLSYRVDTDNYIGIVVLDAIKWLNSSSFEKLYEFAGIEEDRLVWAFGAKRKLSNKSMGLYSSFAPDYYLGFYTEGYTIIEPGYNSYTLSLQYMFEKSIGSELGGSFFYQMFGGKFDMNFQNITTVLAYNFVASDDGPQEAWGFMPSYNLMIYNRFNRPKEHSIRVGAVKPVLDNFKIIANIGSGFTPNSGKNASLNTMEYDLTFDYTLKDIVHFRLRGVYYNELSSNLDITPNDLFDFRFIVNYYWK